MMPHPAKGLKNDMFMLYYGIISSSIIGKDTSMSESYPTILLDIWDLWQKESLLPEEEEKLSSLFYDLEEDMRKACCGPSVDRDAVHGELIALFQRSSQESLKLFSKKYYLSNDIRKRIAKKQNHEGYLLDQKIRKALRELMKAGDVNRKDDPSRRIHKLSEFKLSVVPDQKASRSNYEGEIDSIGRLCSNYQKDMEELLRRILLAFNGWTQFGEIKEIIWNHVPNTMKIETYGDEFMFDKDEEEDNSRFYCTTWSADILSDYSRHGIAERCEEIWDSICKITDTEYFCLFILPVAMDMKKQKKQQDFEAPGTTLSGQKDRVIDMLIEQTTLLFGTIEREEESFFTEDEDRDAVIMGEVCLNLNHRCKEKGYDPHILDAEDAKPAKEQRNNQ